MFEVKTMNNIAQQGLDELAARKLTVNVDAENPDGLLIRSAKLHDAVFGDRLLAIARAGVGTDNVPVARCTEAGIAVFNTGDPDKDAAFCKAATAAGFVNVKGHRLVGGMRASIYNAVPVKAVKALVEFMKDYEVKNRV